MQATADWLDRNAGHHDRFFLFVDEFDPHEPFDTPERWAYRYHDQRDEPLEIWPPYGRKVIEKGVITTRQAEQLRANYGSKLSMIDHWLGKVLDSMDQNGLWDDTALFLVTDHGHYLGERDEMFGKPLSPIYDLLGAIPMLVAWPGVEPGDRGALTTSVDVHATLTDLFDLETEHRTHGVSLRSVIEGTRPTARDHLLQGYFGREVNVIDKDGKYIRGVEGEQTDVSVWSNRWSTMPVHVFPRLSLARPDDRATLDHMPGSDVPVIRQPFTADDLNSGAVYLAGRTAGAVSELYDASDTEESEDLADSSRSDHYVDLLRHALTEVEAPTEQFVRLGLN
jgi:arylsulfatase A-like enzyme